MYRAQDIGTRETLIETCLKILESGKKKELYEILPHISVVRSPLFLEPLLKLLRAGNRDKKVFAALALGSLGDPRAIPDLYKTLRKISGTRRGNQSLHVAIISALGEMGDEQAVEPLLMIYRQADRDLRRRRWVLSALGNLAQQNCLRAIKELIQLMRSKEADLRAAAVAEIAAAYWHRPNELPETVLQQMVSLTQDSHETVRRTAMASLSELANLGCHAAEGYFQRTGQA